MTQRLKQADPAPDFTLPSTQGPQALADYRGRWVVLYFYPKDDTPGCTAQGCDFRDRATSLDAVVLGVSPDSLSSHEAFDRAYGLGFPLLSDENGEIAKAYGVWGTKEYGGKTFKGILRSTFIIDPEGKLAETMYEVQAQGQVASVAERLAELQSG